MELAVLLLTCSDAMPIRVTDYDRTWVEHLVDHTAKFFRVQSGGRVNMTYRVFDWYGLAATCKQWDDWGLEVLPKIRSRIEIDLGVDLSSYTHFALVIDRADSSGGITSGNYTHISAQHLTAALLQHELGHAFGADDAYLDTAAGTVVYADRFCIMGGEGTKYSFKQLALMRILPGNILDSTLASSGPGMSAPALRACGWLDLSRNGIDLSAQLRGDGISRATLAPLQGGSKPGKNNTFCAYVDGFVPGKRVLIEYRVRAGWDKGIPAGVDGWVIAHLTGMEAGLREPLQIGAVGAFPGRTITTTKAGIRISVDSVTASSVSVTLQAVAAVSVVANVAVASWEPERLDIVAVGGDRMGRHKAWAAGWHPSDKGWETLSGNFIAPQAIVSWGKERLDIFGIDAGSKEMRHKAWANQWHPSPYLWEELGGEFITPPAVCSWSPGRLDIFGVGRNGQLYHKSWDAGWNPSVKGWESRGGGNFLTPPAVCSWGPDRLDLVAIGQDGVLCHKSWDGSWHPSVDGWNALGDGFTGIPAVCSWGPGRLDIFAIRENGSMWHKAWDKGWHPSPADWEFLGGAFLGSPAVASWGVGRLDIFGIDFNGAMYHKGYGGVWDPSTTEWEYLGGGFTSPPAVVSWGPKRLDIFALGRDSAVWHKAWAESYWHPSLTGWESLGGHFA